MLTMQDVLTKMAYSVVFFKLCFVTAYIHYFFNSTDYSQIENVARLNTSTLNRIIDMRGIHRDKKILALERTDLVELVTSTGTTYSAELKMLDRNSTRRVAKPKTFNSAGELLESVEDSRGHVWIIQIVHSPDAASSNKFFECGGGEPGAFLSNTTWLDLTTHLSTFDIQTGTFNCQNDPFFCMSRGWDTPQLVLGLIEQHETTTNKSPRREFAEMYQYNNCKLTGYDSIFSWIELVLRKRLLSNNKKLLSSADEDVQDDDDKSSSLILDLYYMERWNEEKLNNNNLPSKRSVPLYFSTLSVKYNNRARFHLVDDASYMPAECGSGSKSSETTTPIYLTIGQSKICYNFGANLNELPNYAHFDLFLLFLYPDMNVIFMLSFLLLNAHLIMIFFEYNEQSLLKQLLIGFIYLCIFNFILFTIWTLTTNLSSTAELVPISRLVTKTCKQLLTWTRYVFMQHHFARKVFAHLRYLAFFHIYIQPMFSIAFYAILALVYHFHTRLRHQEQQATADDDKSTPPSKGLIGKIARKFSTNRKYGGRGANASFNSEDLASRKMPPPSSTNSAAAATATTAATAQNRHSTFIDNDNSSSSTARLITTHNRSALLISDRTASLSQPDEHDEPSSDQSVPSLTPVRTDESQQSMQAADHESPATPPFYDLDVEISVSELIDQINGLTTIWLESSTHADRILSSLPSIEYCKCFYINTVKIHNCDETDTERDGTTTAEESDEQEEGEGCCEASASDARARKKAVTESCACGRNSDLNKYLDENNIKVFDRIRRECSICLDKYQFGCLIKILPCGHAFHQRCIYEWFMSSVNYKCPVCRTCFYKYKKTI